MTEIACLDISSLSPQAYQRLFRQASPRRQARAERYLRQEDKNRCVAADALLRYAVHQRLGQSSFTVEQDSFGKPYLPEYPDFHYNISHSGRFVVIAYGDSPVGVDVQQMRLDSDRIHLAHRYYTPQEQAYVFDKDGSCREDRFFQVWTAKESYLKYLGIGLRRSLNTFSVVPNGTNLAVQLKSTFVQDCCLTLCSDQPCQPIHHLDLSQLYVNQE